MTARAMQNVPQAKPTSTANASLQRSISATPTPIQLQCKLTVNQPGDKFEQEADRVAEQVMRMPQPALQRECACGNTSSSGDCPECQKQKLTSKGVLQREPQEELKKRSMLGSDYSLKLNMPSLTDEYFKPDVGGRIPFATNQQTFKVPPTALNLIDWKTAAMVAANKAFTTETHGGDPPEIGKAAAQAGFDDIGQQLFGKNRLKSALTGAATGAVGQGLLGEDPAMGAAVGGVVSFLFPGPADKDYQIALNVNPGKDDFRITFGITFNERAAVRGIRKIAGSLQRTRTTATQSSINGRNSSSAGAHTAPAIVNDVLSSSGSPLPTGTRSFMDSRFGQDFSHVRVHTDQRAAESAASVQAKAYTVGNNIVFGRGESPAGDQQLLAHELTHVVQQSGQLASPRPESKAKNLGKFPVSGTGRLQRQPKGGKRDPQTEDCPPMERGEKKEAAKAQLRVVERIPQQEWLIHGFPIGGSEISGAEAGGFISDIVDSLMQGHFIYVTGQDPLEVLGFSDCFAGPKVDNHALRQLRAAKFCAGVKDYLIDSPKSYADLIRSCEAAPADQYVGSNATPTDRAHNRGILIRRLPAAKVQFQEGNESFPYNPKYAPSEAHCAAYSTSVARDILWPVYTKNAHCSCLVTPDEPHNNCVRDCLQDNMWTLLANASRDRKPGDPPMDLDSACLIIWQHHRDCYHDCGCVRTFIDFLPFYAVCKIPLPCALDSIAINVFNRCMPATKKDKYLPVD